MADLHRGAQVAAANADANTNVNVRAGARTPSPYSSARSSSPRRCVSYLDYEDSRASSPREEHQQESRKGYNPFLRTRTEILPSPSSYVSLPQTPPSPAIRRICISRSRIPSPSYSAANEIAGGDSYSPSPPPLLPHPPQPIVIVIPETDRTRSPSYANSDDGATPEPISPEYVPNKTLSPRYIVQNETDENDDDDDVDDDDGRRSDASRGLVDAPIPNIPRWLTDWSKSAVKDSRSIHAPPKRSRPPLPPVPTKVDNNGDGGAWQNGDSVPLFQPYPSQPQPQPQRAPAPLAPQNRIQAQARAQDQTQTGASKAEGTPQFALRSDSMAHMSRNDYYASAFPSSWPTIPPYASPPPAPSTTTSTLESPVHATAIRVPVNNSNNNGFGMQTSQFHQPANVQRMSHFFNTPNCGQSTARSGSVSGSNRDIPNSYGSGPMPNPLYTSSTLPKDRTSAFLPPPSWSELAPPQRRLRFAPLPPTPGSDTRRGSGPPPVIPHFHNSIYCPPPPPPMPPQPSNYTGVGVGNMNMYTYQAPTPRPVVPPVVIPIPPAPSFSTPSVTGAPRVQHSTLNMNLFGTNSYPASKKYCFADATVVFRVENCLYKVHRHFFELHSPHLRQLLRPYYFSFNNHIFLSDVKKVEFERLLSIFYPSDLTKRTSTPSPDGPPCSS
ncbi:hypothetical protein CPB84DRAFT_936188 [Gymnopilus junonius]|uniref:BTB domain-containing protein n=1 Tax=Gymnopilus junonius TaxID=109634 RepID=A0A9P5NZ67_GYMJU|nr:hypothetical protein CPB84DRAFT_936188 [Gymnopilus junonius]